MQSGKINTLRRHVKYKSERTRGKYWNPRDQEFETNLKLLLLPPNTARTYPSSDLKSDWKRARSGRYLILVSRSSSPARTLFSPATRTTKSAKQITPVERFCIQHIARSAVLIHVRARVVARSGIQLFFCPERVRKGDETSNERAEIGFAER